MERTFSAVGRTEAEERWEGEGEAGRMENPIAGGAGAGAGASASAAAGAATGELPGSSDTAE